jgi:DNA-3-methyladenine glycosylase
VLHGKRLTRSFFARPCLEVAADLVGRVIVRVLPDGSRLAGRLVEVEAYLGDGSDSSSHSHRGPTPRNRSMFGPPGRIYAYRSYGVHTCINVVCEAQGRGAAVLLRAFEPLEGNLVMRELRGLADERSPREIARGPGRLAQALGFGLEHDGASVLRGAITLRGAAAGLPPLRVATGPRIGISKASELPYRFYAAENPWVSPWRGGAPRGRREARGRS